MNTAKVALSLASVTNAAAQAECDCSCHAGYVFDDRGHGEPDCWLKDLGYDKPCCNDTSVHKLDLQGAEQDSTWPDEFMGMMLNAENALDGNPATMAHTEIGKGHWWSAELNGAKEVTEVKITNRQDCCGDRLTGTEVFIGMNGTETKCGRIEGHTTNGAVYSVACPAGTVGDRVYIRQDTTKTALQLAVVEAWGKDHHAEEVKNTAVGDADLAAAEAAAATAAAATAQAAADAAAVQAALDAAAMEEAMAATAAATQAAQDALDAAIADGLAGAEDAHHYHGGAAEVPVDGPGSPQCLEAEGLYHAAATWEESCLDAYEPCRNAKDALDAADQEAYAQQHVVDEAHGAWWALRKGKDSKDARKNTEGLKPAWKNYLKEYEALNVAWAHQDAALAAKAEACAATGPAACSADAGPGEGEMTALQDNMAAACHLTAVESAEIRDALAEAGDKTRHTDWGRVALEGIGHIAHERFERENEICKWDGSWKTTPGKGDFCAELREALWDSYDLAASLANDQCPGAGHLVSEKADGSETPTFAYLQGYDLPGYDKMCFWHKGEQDCEDECAADDGCTGGLWVEHGPGFCCHKHTDGLHTRHIRWFGPHIKYFEKAATAIRHYAGRRWATFQGYDLLGWDKKCEYVDLETCLNRCREDDGSENVPAGGGCTGAIWLQTHNLCCYKHTDAHGSKAFQWYGESITYYEKQ